MYQAMHPGDVWKAKDSVISLLDSATRKWHRERFCVVLSNQDMCSEPEWPIVLIAPLSHILYPKAKPDLLIGKTDKNGLEVASRLILSHIQPIRKVDLVERVGEISLSKWEEVMRQVFWHIDRS